MIVVGNKTDLQRQVSQEEIENWCKINNMLYLEACAKENDPVDNIFIKITSFF